MKRRSIACIFVLFPNKSNADAHNKLGENLYIRGDLDEALREFHTALYLNPKCVESRNYIGKIYYAKKNVEKAKEFINGIINLGLIPNKDTYYLLGNIYHDQGDVDQAIVKYRQALDLAPEDIEICDSLQKVENIEQQLGSFYSNLAKHMSEQGYDVNPHFDNKKMNEILEDIKHLKGIGLVSCKRVLTTRIVVIAMQADGEERDRISIANNFHQYLIKLHDADISAYASLWGGLATTQYGIILSSQGKKETCM